MAALRRLHDALPGRQNGRVPPADQPFRVTVHGDNLVALAAALRLSRLGHRVSLVCADPRWRRDSTRPLAATLPPVLELPSAWKDLFAKSGRSMDAELSGRGLRLVQAPSPVHLLDGDELTLPTERADQLSAVRRRFGPDVADCWRAVLDRADEIWQARRRLGVERAVTSTPRVGSLPETIRTTPALTGLTRDLPDLLAACLDSLGPLEGGTRPGAGGVLLAADLAVPRVFGRWHLVGPQGPTDLQPLLDLLDARLDRRGIAVLAGTRPASGAPVNAAAGTGSEGPADAVVEATAPPVRRRPIRRQQTFWAPVRTLTTTLAPDPRDADEGIREQIEHTPDGPVVRWRWRNGDRLVTVTDDHTRPVPDPARGPALSDTGGWRRRPVLGWTRHDGVATLAASPASHGGPEPWAQLLTGALAAYQVHLHLTGEDVSPTNRAVGADGRAHRRMPSA